MTDTPLALVHKSDDWEAEVWMRRDEWELVRFEMFGVEQPLANLTPALRSRITDHVIEWELP